MSPIKRTSLIPWKFGLITHSVTRSLSEKLSIVLRVNDMEESYRQLQLTIRIYIYSDRDLTRFVFKNLL